MSPYQTIRSAFHPLRAKYVHLKDQLANFARSRAPGGEKSWIDLIEDTGIYGYLGINQSVSVVQFQWQMLREGHIARQLRIDGFFEPAESDFVAKSIKPNAIMLDIGANSGYFSLLASTAEPSANIFAFEPCSATFNLLNANINLCRRKNIRIYKYALSDSKGTATLNVNAHNHDGLNTMGKPSHQHSKVVGTETIYCVRLDDWLSEQEIERVDLIKIDVEGAELLVFKGAKELLSRGDAPTVMFELSNLCEKGFGHSSTDVVDFLKSCGYTVNLLTDDGNLVSLIGWDGVQTTAIATKQTASPLQYQGPYAP